MKGVEGALISIINIPEKFVAAKEIQKLFSHSFIIDALTFPETDRLRDFDLRRAAGFLLLHEPTRQNGRTRGQPSLFLFTRVNALIFFST